MLHYALGDALVRALTLASRAFFDDPPDAFSEAPIGRKTPMLVHARADELAALDALGADIAPFAALDRLDQDGVAELCPLLRIGEGGAVAEIADRDGIRIDPHALLQEFLKSLRAHKGRLVTDARAASIIHATGAWTVTTDVGDTFSAPLVVNAAGAWGGQSG